MGLFKTVGNIFRAKAKELDDALKNPQRDLELAIVDSKKKMSQFREEISKLNAQQKLLERQLKEKQDKVGQLEAMATRAVEAGNESDAIQILERQQAVTTDLESLEKQIQTNQRDITGARDQLQAMQAKIMKAEMDKKRLNVRMQSAEIREGLARAKSTLNTSGNPLSALDDLEKAVNQAEAKADAVQEDVALEAGNVDADLESKYAGGAASASIQDKLAALKAKANK